MLKLSLFSAHIWLFFFNWAYIGSWISIFSSSFADFLKERFLLRFCCSSDESLRFWHRDSKAVVLNSFRVHMKTPCKRIFPLLSQFFLSLCFSLCLSRCLSLTWLLFFSCGVHCKLKTLMFLFIVFEWNVFFFFVCSSDENFWFWFVIVRLWFWILFVVLKQYQYAFWFVLGFHVLIFSVYLSLSLLSLTPGFFAALDYNEGLGCCCFHI